MSAQPGTVFEYGLGRVIDVATGKDATVKQQANTYTDQQITALRAYVDQQIASVKGTTGGGTTTGSWTTVYSTSFDDATGWNGQGGWTISGGNATLAGNQGDKGYYTVADGTLNVGDKIKITYTVASGSSGTYTPMLDFVDAGWTTWMDVPDVTPADTPTSTSQSWTCTVPAGTVHVMLGMRLQSGTVTFTDFRIEKAA